MICDAFFSQILTKLNFLSIPWSEMNVTYLVTTELHQLWLLSQVGGLGFEPRQVLENFFPSSWSWVRTSPSPYFFCNKRVAENIPVLRGRLVVKLFFQPFC